jgi:hypothetical protein
MKTITILLSIIIYALFTSYKIKYEKFYDDTHLNILFHFDIIKKPLRKPYKLQLPKIYLYLNLSYLGSLTIEINNKNEQISYQN